MPQLNRPSDQKTHERRRIREERMLGFSLADYVRVDPQSRRLISNAGASPEARRRFVSDWRTARERAFEKYRTERAQIRAVDGVDEVERSFSSFALREFHALQGTGLVEHVRAAVGGETNRFLFDFESQLQFSILDELCEQALATDDADRLAVTIPSGSRKEILNFLIDGSSYADGASGSVRYDDLTIVDYDVTILDAAKGFKIRKQQLEDLDSNAIDAAGTWTRNTANQGRYWKRKKVMQMIRDAASSGNVIAYDGKDFFATDHPVNPDDPQMGDYANILTGAPSGAYPGACPIDRTNAATDDIALQNVTKALKHVLELKAPNGDPRYFSAAEISIVHPPALLDRVQTITKAKIISRLAAEGIELAMQNVSFGSPMIAPELGAAYGGSDTTYYLNVRAPSASKGSAFLHVLREAFSIQFYSGMSPADGIDAALMRAQELEWLSHGRYAVAPGQPHRLHKCEAT
jgi:hypothetical protein